MLFTINWCKTMNHSLNYSVTQLSWAVGLRNEGIKIKYFFCHSQRSWSQKSEYKLINTSMEKADSGLDYF